ncbi:GumC family protein [Compostibacter hankyongensis]|uniref:non-specific protein-tyrosine kinase n=1 Tax=Compostibacter hankyongensis TaxID=1007089 RepID=A0ABP8G8B4_9BACT
MTTYSYKTSRTKRNVRSPDDIDFSLIFRRILSGWPVILASIAIFILGAFLYLKYASPVWQITGKMLVEDQPDRLSGSLGFLADNQLTDLGSFAPNANNEVQVLNSRSLMTEVVNDMHLNITTYRKNGLATLELYGQAPFETGIRYKGPVTQTSEYKVNILKNRKLHLVNEEENIDITTDWMDSVRLKEYTLVFKPRQITADEASDNYLVIVTPAEQAVEELSDNFEASLSDKQATTIDLVLDYPDQEKGEAVLQKIIDCYLDANLQNKVKTANSTLAFIDDRLSMVSNELQNVEKELERYKSRNDLADIEEQSKTLIGNASSYFDKLNEQEIQISVTEDLERYLSKPGNEQTVPTSLIVPDPSFSTAVNQYNTLLLEKDRLSLSLTSHNPALENLDLQISNARKNLLKGLSAYKNGLIIAKNRIGDNFAGLERKLRNVPAKERIFIDYSRQQNVKQQLYLFLLQKKEETAISKTSTLSNARIIDNAKSDRYPFKPQKKIIYAFAVLAGCIIPIIGLQLREALHVKLRNKADIEQVTDIPVVGEISHNHYGENIVVHEKTRSAISEHFRNLRTNLQFLIRNDAVQKVILFTSSMGEEGKSFLSANLANTLAISGKKVVMIELDLRKPKLSSYLGMNNHYGYSNYIAGGDHDDIWSIIRPSSFNKNCFVISSGPIPPNPAELLLNEKLGILIDKLKENFDYIIIDSPPAGLVSDALIIEKFTDITLYVARIGRTHKLQLKHLNELRDSGKLKNVYLVVNDIHAKYNGYGGYGYGGYGYGYLEDEKTDWLKRILGKKAVS